MRLQEYKSIEDKEKVFGEKYKYILTVKDFEDWYKNLQSGSVYRGLNNASYKNYTSLQRLFIKYDKEIAPWKFVEKEIEYLKEVNNHLLVHFFKSTNIEATDFSYLSYLQHYKDGATPLLDFTTDINTALFFMCDGATFPECGDGDFCFWKSHSISSFASIYYLHKSNCYNSERYINELCIIFKEDIESQCDNISHNENLKPIKKMVVEEGIRNRLEKYMSLKYMKQVVEKDVPLLLEDKILPIDCIKSKTNFVIANPNLVAQKGCFLFNSDEHTPFEKGLSCVDIHKSLIPFIQKKYLRDEYTRSTMFPNMDDIVSKVVTDSLADLHE